MSIKWVFLVSLRYISSGRKGRKISSGILSAVGIAVGVMAMITVISVMNGFQMGFIDDILEISSFHLRIEETEGLDAEDIRGIKGVSSVMPFAESQSLILTAYSPEPCIIKGLPANAEELDPSFFSQLNIIEGSYSPGAGKTVLIGRVLAYRIGANTGDSVSIVALNGKTFSTLRPELSSFTVSGIFQSGYSDFDSSLIVMPLESLSYIDESSRLQLGVKLKNRFSDRKIISILEKKDPASAGGIVSWRSYNRSFFSALKLEKSVMTILLGLIFLITAFGIFNATRRTVAEKQQEIGILRAVGAAPGRIRQIFVMDGIIIGLGGGLPGIAAGLLAAFNINGILSLFPGAGSGFLVNVPVRVVPSEVLLIFLIEMMFCILSAYLASGRVSRIMPQEVLRYE